MSFPGKRCCGIFTISVDLGIFGLTSAGELGPCEDGVRGDEMVCLRICFEAEDEGLSGRSIFLLLFSF